ncbi:MAG TPA: hypothetical protein VLC79_18310 [Cellvibrio sp.]|nr:hypothetical protein [Cellvibrio sp.]
MNPSASKSKWKRNLSHGISGQRDASDDYNFAHEHISRPKEKLGKRKFKIQREIDDYFASAH